MTAMVAEKDGPLQLDHATWETLRGLVQLEVSSQAHLWSDTLETSRAAIDSRLQEFHGIVSTVDREHSATLALLGDRQGHMESKLANLEVDVHKWGATARGDVRRAADELDGKIQEMRDRDASELRELENLIDRETQALRDQFNIISADITAKQQDLQQQVIDDRAESQATQTRCMHYCDRHVAAAMGSKELEARFQVVRDSVIDLDKLLHQVDDIVRGDLSKLAQEIAASLSVRMDQMAQLSDTRNSEINAAMDICSENAHEAAESADKATRLIDESLHQKVHTASRNLMEQIEAAAARAAGAGQNDEFAKEAAEQHLAKRAQELQAGFYSLVAREALDTEIRALVDRATRRLQIVADDLAQRSVTIQDHVVASEERLSSALDFAQRLAAEYESSQKDGMQRCSSA